MKKIIGLFLLIAMPFLANAAQYEEGKHYTVVSDKASKKPELREFFSFYCPHCFSFEPFMADIKKQLPADVAFERNHVDFLRMAPEDIQFMLTKGLVVAQQLDMEEKLVGAMFNYVQVQRAAFSSEKDLRNLFVLNGVDGEQFDKLMKSFNVNSQAKKMKKTQDYYGKRGAIKGVPAVIVNGKYLINMQELDRNDLKGDYNKLVKHLLSLG
ncbi:thiol:disulfide interchange protein DsbA/DsbL [Thalassotalea sp. LPB0316]|uniref:thiol:disulfide interchange protein DsbA/DsbL n=1 Tax=Thalassotalea sp. LPB0316 TaxID=2769490 RepID=UPI00186686FE|nr:thiol:disulfide interchange protein DsbA/DsbL [Thalassotalea sp. LPB0316]QOL26194.1 thiol:disulfide interchange protein DsbA/DsbL [Thalassotalea sp. LPB0316]